MLHCKLVIRNETVIQFLRSTLKTVSNRRYYLALQNGLVPVFPLQMLFDMRMRDQELFISTSSTFTNRELIFPNRNTGFLHPLVVFLIYFFVDKDAYAAAHAYQQTINQKSNSKSIIAQCQSILLFWEINARRQLLLL